MSNNHEVDKCPNCGFEVDLSPRERRSLLLEVSDLKAALVDAEERDSEVTEIIEHFENILHQITALCDSYPEFVEPTKEQWLVAHHLLNRAGGCTLAAISGSRRHHVIDGVKKIIDKAPKKAIING